MGHKIQLISSRPTQSVRAQSQIANAKHVFVSLSRGKLNEGVSVSFHCRLRLLIATRASWKCTLQTPVVGSFVTTISPLAAVIAAFVQFFNIVLCIAGDASCCLLRGHLLGRNARFVRRQTVITIKADVRVTFLSPCSTAFIFFFFLGVKECIRLCLAAALACSLWFHATPTSKV